jgi:hypothetical protein
MGEPMSVTRKNQMRPVVNQLVYWWPPWTSPPGIMPWDNLLLTGSATWSTTVANGTSACRMQADTWQVLTSLKPNCILWESQASHVQGQWEEPKSHSLSSSPLWELAPTGNVWVALEVSKWSQRAAWLSQASPEITTNPAIFFFFWVTKF